MNVVAHFAWDRISDGQFEEIVYAVLEAAAPRHLNWRRGPGDKGRDIQAVFARRDGIGELIEETYYVEAKRHREGISPTDIAAALAWAAVEVPQVFLLAVSSHLTTPCREHVQAWARANPRVRVVVWERKEMETRVLTAPGPRALAVQFGVLPPAVHDLLPLAPEFMRTGPSDFGMEMEYRYWITDGEADKLTHVVDTLQRLGEALETESHRHKYFELTSLAVPNWSTFLTLLQAQLKLEIAIRDYLLAQSSGADDGALREIAVRLESHVEKVRELGDTSFHVD